MSITKLPDGRWRLDFYPEGFNYGRGKRIRKNFATKGEAIYYQNHLLKNIDDKPWLAEQKDNRRTLRELIEIWFSHHGVTIDDGEKRKLAMIYADDCMGNLRGVQFNARAFSAYREKRISGQLRRAKHLGKVAPRTMNLELSYFRAMFNELTRMGEWTLDNPVASIRPFKTEESEMAFLTYVDIDNLLLKCETSSNKDLITVVKICLATGARWSEAESLRYSNLSPFRITYTNTKGNRNRTVPISEALYNEIITRKERGKLFSSCYSAFRSALKRTKIELPRRQMSHVLRHTFASHFMMNGGNILVLQRILGHTDIKMTMRYAHFAPDHLNEAVQLNPLEFQKRHKK